MRMLRKQVFRIGFFWMLIGALDALFTHSVTQNEFIRQTEAYRFWPFITVNSIVFGLAGMISGYIILFYLKDRFRHRSFGLVLIMNTLAMALMALVLNIIAYFSVISLWMGKNPFNPDVLQEVGYILFSSYNVKNGIFAFSLAVGTSIVLQINNKFGPGVLTQLLLGRYHRPREEERIFMFLDLKSSTTIAEKLGHFRFYELLNDFFSDITDSIIYSRGEIYQYVGDEVVVSWQMKYGLRNASCIRCFYSIKEAIAQRATKYKLKYGFVPQFKAGLHCGPVTVGEIGEIKKEIVFTGDVLNTTSRIQNMCNEYSVNILISKMLLDRLLLPPHSYNTNKIGDIELKGKKQVVRLYTLVEEE
ncbi:MAG: adenylate/guanylate cyclase domain-containing protein [Bacteroidetes bacterium]|nr:adenylate/guanylate cyclase domain-containing protein [Bacteroidota bacterium]